MATRFLTLKNGFIDTERTFNANPTHAIVNAWDCQVKDDGTVECNYEKEYKDGVHSIRYLITPNGFAKLTIKLPSKPVKVLKKGFVLPKGEKLSDGRIGLSNGMVDERYAYFRQSSFQEYLNANNLTAVRHENPNREYRLPILGKYAGICKTSLMTDGEKVLVKETENNEYWWVTGASWVRYEVNEDVCDTHNHARILYTLRTDLENIKFSA